MMSPQERLAALAAQLSAAEALSLLSGKDLWHLKGLPNHGIPSIRVSDGPSGIRGTKTFNGTRTTSFPCATAAAATWDVELIQRIGHAMGDEAHAKGVHLILGPTINIHRSPLGGRNFESYSEDPFLSGALGTALVNGLQSNNIGAVVKHFVCNDQETNRNKVNVVIDERALHEIYLKPFEMVCSAANPWALMAAYNRVNGVHASENSFLLQDVLRKSWRWDGLLMSDWWGTYSTVEAINAGLDVEMPGPTRWRGEAVMSAISGGKIEPKRLYERARRVLALSEKIKTSGIPENAVESEHDTESSRLLNREVASKAIVLCKNNKNVLPLRKVPRVAIIGPNSQKKVAMGGGSASVSPYYYVSAYDGIKGALSQKWPETSVSFAQGCYSNELLPMLETTRRNGEPGLDIEVFDHAINFADRKAATALSQMSTRVNRMMFFDADCVPPSAKPVVCMYMSGFFSPSVDGDYEFGLITSGRAKLFINGKLLIDNWTQQKQGKHFFGLGTIEVRNSIALLASERYEVSIEYTNASAFLDRKPDLLQAGALHIGARRMVTDEALIDEATKLALSADVCILCLGTDGEVESEGFDKTTMKLRGCQDELASAILTVNPSTVVVNFSGSAVEMPWADQASTIIQAWFLGSELGNALTDVLLGTVNPSGKLPITFPKKLEHTPSYGNFPGDVVVHYREGILVGYRHFVTRQVDPLFAFGHGLSYTTFAYDSIVVVAEPTRESPHMVVQVVVRNSGLIDGDTTVQIYLSKPESAIFRPKRELRAFRKVRNLSAGAFRSISVELEKDAFSYWDEVQHRWVVEGGAYCIEAAESSASVLASCTYFVSDGSGWL